MKSLVDLVINRIVPDLSEKSRLQISSLCEKCAFKSGTTIVSKDHCDVSEYFLINGVARNYLMNQEGELITLMFFEELEILSPHVTRTQNTRSLINIEAITDCTLLRLSAEKFEKLIEMNLEIREFANTVLRKELFRKINKEIQLISWTARARLEQFREDFHMLENRIPHHMIASYLGITQVSLSRLRQQN